jgi:hypothetical protein
MMVGAVLLELVSDWDAWVFRRVDSFYFAGDDERVLCRRQSVDFSVPRALCQLDLDLLDDFGGFPVPLTFVNKWRLPEFSLRDERDAAVSLLPRQDSVPLAAGMLMALGTSIMSCGASLVPVAGYVMPREVRRLLYEIVASEPIDGLRLCSDFAPAAASEPATEEYRWRVGLACNEAFMSLAFELARGFLMLAVLGEPVAARRVMKFTYNSYVVPTSRDRRSERLRHLGRVLVHRARDIVDPPQRDPMSPRGQRKSGQLVLSSLCNGVPEGLREGGPAVAAALATVSRLDGSSRAVRLRPTGAVAIDLPPGTYTVSVSGRSGFDVEEGAEHGFDLKAGGVERLHVRTRRNDVGAPVTLAPRVARPASRSRTLSRGCAWHSKPLLVRMRLGDGGSYHCEFEAPAGLHVTRAKLAADGEAETDANSETAPGHAVDLVLASTQRSHLYAPAHHAKPATGYALLNLRPRVETVARPAFWTAIAATGTLAFVAAFWHARGGFSKHGPADSTALLVVILGGPSALAAYFAQAIPSRVTNAMLYGLRLLALLPAVMSLSAGSVMLVGEHRAWSHAVLWVLVGLSGLTIAMLGTSSYFAEHPREQRRRDADQGEGFEERSHADAGGSDGTSSNPSPSRAR